MYPLDDHEALNKMIDQLVNRNTGKANNTREELLGTTKHLDELYCEAPDNPPQKTYDSNHLDSSSSFSREEKRYMPCSKLCRSWMSTGTHDNLL